VKIVPIVALPLLLLMVARSGRRRLMQFVVGAGIPFVLLWIPVIVQRGGAFKRDVIGFKGYPGNWGVVEIAMKANFSNHAIDQLIGPGRTVLLVVAAGLPFLLAWRRPAATIEAFGLTLVLVLLLSTATGGRYLVWAVGAAFLIDVSTGVVYNVAASVLLIKVYDHWSNALPWHWDRAHASPWNHTEIGLAAVAWIALLAVALMSVRALWDRTPPTREIDVNVGETADLSAVG
jgi:lysylphosphatidylglycerol synthetase-like protein (DUF2156 family)